MSLKLTVAAYAEGGTIPVLHTCDGANISPAVEWSDEPAGTQSFVLILDDPDAPGGVWNHWLLYDISPSVRVLAQGYKAGHLGVSGANDFGKLGYGGPCPPRGAPHRYFLRLFAVAVPSLGLKHGAKRAAIDQALQGHILAEAQYMGRYQRK